jgi:hypothetical protein
LNSRAHFTLFDPRIKMTQDVFGRLEALRNNPAALRKVADLLDQIDKEAARKAYRDRYVSNLISLGADHAHLAFLLKVSEQPKTYGPTEFVPDPYETLEANGLVFCSYSGGGLTDLRARTISITTSGLEALRQIANAAAPA